MRLKKAENRCCILCQVWWQNRLQAYKVSKGLLPKQPFLGKYLRLLSTGKSIKSKEEVSTVFSKQVIQPRKAMKGSPRMRAGHKNPNENLWGKETSMKQRLNNSQDMSMVHYCLSIRIKENENLQEVKKLQDIHALTCNKTMWHDFDKLVKA